MNKFHKAAMLLASVALVLGLVACPNKAEPKPKPEPTPEPYTILDAGTDGTAGTEATYVTFGEWPQSVLPEGTTVTVDETVSKTVGLFTYYAGSDGNWYVKQEEKANSTGNAYKYSDGTAVKQKSENSTRYFKVEPIKWRVLEEAEGKKFLLAEVGLMSLQYYDKSNERTIDGNTIYANNYMHSKIRAWLNGYKYQLDDADNADYETKGFLQTAFTSEAQAKIATTTVDNSVESTLYSSNPYVCDNTCDKVFLLSGKEATSEGYGFNTENIRIRKPTDFALATGAYNHGGSYGGLWWFRSPNPHPYENDMVNGMSYDGLGDPECYVNYNEHSVVPALLVSQ